MKKGMNKRAYNQIDEHNAPTEPLPDISALLLPTPGQNNFPPMHVAVPAPYVDPRQTVAAYPYTQTPSFAGTNYGVWSGYAGQNAPGTKRHHTYWRRLLPACVSFFFLCLQLLLVARFGISFLSLSPDITWVSMITSVSEVFVNPFRDLWFQLPTVGTLIPANIEVYTLLAVLVYGVLSRLLVGILKIILRIR